MKMSLIKEVLLYRYRFGLGYGLYVIFVITLLAVGIGRIPYGITENEMQSVVTSSQFRPAELMSMSFVDAPYHFIQNISIHMLGLTDVSIKLPSLIFALLSAIALVIMLSRWFTPRIAIITGILAVTTTPFLGMGRLGVPLIMMTFWLSIILLSATRIIHSAKHRLMWKLILAFAVGLSLYTPLMIYPLIALTVAGLLHPHVRYVIRTLKPARAATAGAIFVITIIPLIWTIYQQPSTVTQLLGLPPSMPSTQQILNNSDYVVRSLIRFSSPIAAEIITPLFGIVTIIIAALGFLKSAAQWYSARSYMIGLWLLLTIPVILLNPYYLPAIFVVTTLLIAIGLDTLIRSWYQLFPRNPYARIAGLIPLTVLIATVAFTNAGRYFYGYLYAPQVDAFHTELETTHEALHLPGTKDRPVTLMTTPQSEAFYSILKWQYPKLTVTSQPSPSDAVIVHERHFPVVKGSLDGSDLYRLYTNPYYESGLDVRVYTARES